MDSDSDRFRIPAWGGYDEIVVIPACLSQSGSSFSYTLTAEVRNDVLKPARPVGDFDADGDVDFTDFFAFANGFGETADQTGFGPAYDLNGDGEVGMDDFFVFASHFGETAR